MEKKKRVEKIGLGTVQFGIPYGISNKLGQTKEGEVSRILSFAKKEGIKIIDTAAAYGASEEVLGKNNLSDFQVVSKFMGDLKIETQLHLSLQHLNIQQLYGFLAHRPQEIIQDGKKWIELRRLQDRGLIRKIGFSINRHNEIKKIKDMNIIPDILQVPYNYFDNRFEDEMIDLKSKGCEIHTRSSFLQGLFFCNPEDLSSFFDPIKRRIQDLQDTYKGELASKLLQYCLDKSFIDNVVIGVNDLNQLKRNISSLSNSERLTENSVDITEAILNPSLWPKQ